MRLLVACSVGWITAHSSLAGSSPPGERDLAFALILDLNTPSEPQTDTPAHCTSFVPIVIPADLTASVPADFVGRLALRVDETGGVRRVLFESPRPVKAVTEVVTSALREWTFAPPRRNGRAVSALYRCSYAPAPHAADPQAPKFSCIVLPEYPRALRRGRGLTGGKLLAEQREWRGGPQPTAATASNPRTSTTQARALAAAEAARADPRPQTVVMPPSVSLPWFSAHVTLRLSLGTSGTPGTVEVIRSTSPIFEPYAAEAALASRWGPLASVATDSPITLILPVPFPGSLQATPPLFLTPDPDAGPDGSWDEPPRLRVLDLPVFPQHLVEKRVSGRARARVELDANGSVTTTTLLEATRPEFGHALLASIARCAHDPARSAGKRVPARFIRTATFQLKPDDDPLNETETPALLLPHRDARAPVGAGTLDAPPTLIVGQRSEGGPANTEPEVTVEFIVDARGHVCEPRIVAASSEAAGYAAVQRVASWLYAPPRQAGTIVPARLRVSFPGPRD